MVQQEHRGVVFFRVADWPSAMQVLPAPGRVEHQNLLNFRKVTKSL